MIRVFLIIGFLLPAFAQGQPLYGSVTEIVDGNTLMVQTTDGDTYRVVLQGIDCPELEQPYGDEARTLLQKLTGKKKNVALEIRGKDRFRNYVAIVTLPNDQDIRVALLEAGLAWTAERDPEPELEAIRRAAASKKKGLWRDSSATPPWVFRRQQTMTQPKSR